jgi:sugar-phosphatase
MTPSNIQAVIFDMDGVIIDSEPLWIAATEQVFKRLNISLRTNEVKHYIGIRIDVVIKSILRDHSPSEININDIIKYIIEDIIKLVSQKGEASPGLDSVIQFLQHKKVALGLASSSPMSLIRAVVKKLGLTKTFQVLKSAEHLKHGKPHPEVYLNTAKALGVEPRFCLAIEDSIQGILAAKAAGMVCLAKPDVSLKDDPRLAIADRRIERFEQFDQLLWEELSELVE